MLMSNGPQARIAEVVRNPLPRSRQRATLHHEPLFYAVRNHLVDFLVSRSKDLAHGKAPEHPPEIRPGLPAAVPTSRSAEPTAELNAALHAESDSASSLHPTSRAAL